MLEIDSRLAPSAIERLLLQLLRDPNEEVVWPSDVRGPALGGESALLQIVATWAANADAPTMRLPYQSASGDDIEDFLRNIHALAGALLTDSARDLLGEDRSEAVRELAVLKLFQLEGPEPKDALKRGESVAILCADHLGFGTPRRLYWTGPIRPPKVRSERDFRIYTRLLLNSDQTKLRIRDEKDFRLIARWFLKSVAKREHWASMLASSDAIGSMLHELFENTDEHARRDLEGNALRKSMRGFFSRGHSLTDADILEIARDYPLLGEFCRGIPADGANRRSLVEISVFDGGPGLAPRLTGRDFTDLKIDEELDAVRECFRGGVTTKLRSGHGIGLEYVTRLLREKRGFLKVRTGRLALVADLASPGKPAKHQSDLFGDLPDFFDAYGGPPKEVGRVQGTLVTLLVPAAQQ